MALNPQDLPPETQPPNTHESRTGTVWIVLFWSLPFVLALGQALVMWRLVDRIAYEEMSESVRNPYWLAHRTLYDRGSTNVSWYAFLLGLYKIFGFHLHLTRWARLALHVLSMTSAAWLLKRLLGMRRAVIPLCAVALSPTLLYFNAMQAQFGLELQLLPISIVLLVSFPCARLARGLVLQAAFWSLAMVASLAYPAFGLLLPALGIAYLVGVRQFCAHRHWSIYAVSLLVGGLAFVLPFAGFAAFLRDPSILYQGAFRGGSEGFNTNLTFILANLSRTFREFFLKGESYYFTDLAYVEFSGRLAAISAGLAILASALAVRQRKLRLLLGLAWLTILTTLAISAMATNLPGLRRQTPALGAFYVLYALAWREFGPGRIRTWLVRALAVGLLLLPLHHLYVLPENAARIRGDGFPPLGDKPVAYLQELTARAVREPIQLRCPSPSDFSCRYPEVFAAVAGACQWNHLHCQPIQGYDPQTNRFIRLSTDLWETNYFSH